MSEFKVALIDSNGFTPDSHARLVIMPAADSELHWPILSLDTPVLLDTQDAVHVGTVKIYDFPISEVEWVNGIPADGTKLFTLSTSNRIAELEAENLVLRGHIRTSEAIDWSLSADEISKQFRAMVLDVEKANRFSNQLADMIEPLEKEVIELREKLSKLSDINLIHAAILRGELPMITWRQHCAISGPVPNTEEVQLAEIVRLRQRLAEIEQQKPVGYFQKHPMTGIYEEATDGTPFYARPLRLHLLNIDDIQDKTILKIVDAFWRRVTPKDTSAPENIVSITAMRTALMWVDMDRNQAVDSEGGHCD